MGKNNYTLFEPKVYQYFPVKMVNFCNNKKNLFKRPFSATFKAVDMTDATNMSITYHPISGYPRQ